MKQKSVNMLSGSLVSGIIRFSVPVMLTGILQLLFNAVDLIVVGRFCGKEALAAVGSTGSIVGLVVNFFLGFSVGSGVIVAQSLGAGIKEDTQRAVHTAIPFSVVIGIIMTVIGLLYINPILKIMNTPSDIIEKSALYLRIYFCGITLRMLYVFEASILRAAGDTKTPMLSLTLGGILNAGFNLFFVLALNMDVDGVAYGTIISEAVSTIVCFYVLTKRNDAIKFSIKKSTLDFNIIKKILYIGVPSGIQSSMYSISNTLMQSSFNTFGTTVVAGNSAATNITGFMDAISNGIPNAAINFMGQNIGARNYKRAKKIPGTAILCAAMFMIPAGTLCVLFSRQLLSIYITDSEEAIQIGMKKMWFIALPYFICTTQVIFGSCLRGIGKGIIPMINSICGICGVRILIIFTVFKMEKFHRIETLYAAYPISWAVTALVDIIVFGAVWKSVMKKNKLGKEIKQT